MDIENTLVTARKALDGQEAEAAWELGKSMDNEDAVQFTLGEAKKSRAAVQAGYNELMARAGTLSDPDWRRTYLENIPEHRQMVAWWERLQG